MTSVQQDRRSPDIDRGWAYVVLVSALAVQILTVGLSFSFAVLYTTLLEAFDESPAFVAWTINLNVFSFFLTGEIANCAVGIFGPRASVALGGIVSSLGLFSCYFAQSVLTLLFMYGIVAGLGLSFAYFASFPVITAYFRRVRVLAFAVASAGEGLGWFGFTPLLSRIVDEYEWQSVFLILSAVTLNLVVCGAAMMPPRLPQPAVAESKLQPLPPRPNFKRRVAKQLSRQAQDVLLFRRPTWILFNLSYFTSHVGISGFNTHIANHALLLGFSHEKSAFLISLMGIGSLIGRLSAGVVGRLRGVHIVGLFLSMFALLGIGAVGAAFTKSYVGLALCCFVCGLGTGGNGVYPETIIHILGITHLSTGISYSTVSAALGMSVGGPLSASIFEIDPSYRSSFLVVGFSAFIGALLNLPSWLTVRNGRLHSKGSAEKGEITLDKKFGVEGISEDLDC